MTKDLRDVYGQKAISQIPRLLGNMDRNPFSPTYGCFHRDYWLDKTSDFPDAVRQFGVHALALVYKYDFPGSIYQGQPKIRDWTIAAMVFWSKIQHKDGSFDEFYPYERGWVGPTAFTMYTIIEAFQLLKEEINEEDAQTIKQAISKSAHFIAAGETEEDHLANHHAMAAMSVWKAYELLEAPELKKGFEKLWETFTTYHYEDEGWSREYDGVDPGYLSATVSFLGKIYKSNPDPEIRKVLEQSVNFSAYFVYPNGFYAGSAGSRNTLHFYPHGYEILGKEIPLANAIAQKMLKGLSEDKLVPPEIISDRYVFYRVPEFLLAYLDYTGPQDEPAKVPYEQDDFERFYERSRIYTAVRGDYYILANLAKGGVIKVFNRKTGSLMVNDGGIIGRLDNGKVVTSQWVDPSYQTKAENSQGSISGQFHLVPSNKLFTPFKNILFRATLIAIGWIPAMAHWLKGQIRKSLILGQRSIPVSFERTFQLDGNQFTIKDKLAVKGGYTFKNLSFGDEFFVRYVPQSRYFQSQELEVEAYVPDEKIMEQLNNQKELEITRTTDLETKEQKVDV